MLARMEQGYSWVKLHTATAWSFDQGKDGTIETVKALRDQCGNYDQLKILVDVNQAYMMPGAMRVGQVLGELQVSHFEEPIAPWDLDGYNQLQAALEVRSRPGNRNTTYGSFAT